jgi:hypothetical protein
VLIELLNVATSSPEEVVAALEAYMALAMGLVEPRGADSAAEAAHKEPEPAAPVPAPTPAAAADGADAASSAAVTTAAAANAAAGGAGVPVAGQAAHYGRKLRDATVFKWRDSLTKEVREHEDAQADIVNQMINVGLWHCMHAGQLGGALSAGKDEEASKQVYHALRAAASFFNCVERDHLSQLPHEPNTDFDERLIKSMAEQCLAEAQEVTTERARTKQYKAPVMAGLAHDQYDRFNRALALLKTMDEKRVYGVFVFRQGVVEDDAMISTPAACWPDVRSNSMPLGLPLSLTVAPYTSRHNIAGMSSART